jgi:DNA helicase HerA-like ATPase
MFTDGPFRKSVLHHVRDPLVRSFWNREWAAMPPRLQAEAMSPVLNKVGHFVANPITRHILGQSKGMIDFRQLLDERTIVLVKLGKGLVGEDASRLLGSLLITSLQMAAMSRADIEATQRSPFLLYVDEAHAFSSDAFSSILSEGRKYGLAFGGLATQFLEQFDETTLAAILGNVGNVITFGLGPRDAEIIAPWLGEEVRTEDLTRLPRYTAYARLLDRGQPTRPFSISTLPPDRPAYRTQRLNVLRNRSRHRYAKPVALVREDVKQSIPLLP